MTSDSVEVRMMLGSLASRVYQMTAKFTNGEIDSICDYFSKMDPLCKEHQILIAAVNNNQESDLSIIGVESDVRSNIR